MVAGRNGGVRAHGGHPAGSRGVHMTQSEKGVGTRKSEEGFGAGL